MPLPEFGRFAEPALLILTSLSDGPKHGYAIMADVEEGTGRPLGPGTLYAALARLEERGLIEALPQEERRRPYRLTALGATTLTQQLTALSHVRRARPPTAEHGHEMSSPAMIALLVRLYPAAWRRRYGDEFVAVLEARHLGPFDVLDVVVAAVDAHLHFRRRHTAATPSSGFLLSSRIGGAAAIIAGAMLVGGIAWSVLDPADEDPGGAFVFGAVVAILIALVGLSAFQARHHPRLIWTAFLVPAAGTVVAIGGMSVSTLFGDADYIGGFGGWEVFMVGILATFVGSALFGWATWRTRALTRWGAMLLAASSVVAGVAMTGGLVVALPAEFIALGAVVGYAVGWISLGFSALTGGRLVPSVGA